MQLCCAPHARACVAVFGALAAVLAFSTAADAVSEGVTDLYGPFTIESARAAGMGRVTSVAGDGMVATWWNPAGLAFETERRLSGSSADFTFPFFSAADVDYIRSVTLSGPIPLGKRRVGVGAGFKRLDRGGLEFLDIMTPGGAVTDTSESFDHAFVAALGARVGSSLALGVSIEYIWSHLIDPTPALNIADGSGGAFSASLGVAYQLPIRFTADSPSSGQVVLTPMAGASILHLGQKLDYEDFGDGEDLWRQVRAGAGLGLALEPPVGTDPLARARLRQFAFVVALEAYEPVVGWADISTRKLILHFGTELSLFGVVSGRVGFIDDDEGLVSRDETYGVGISLPDGLPVDVSFDWASVPIAGFDRIERRSLAISLRGSAR